jgi:hypothetical protein
MGTTGVGVADTGVLVGMGVDVGRGGVDVLVGVAEPDLQAAMNAATDAPLKAMKRRREKGWGTPQCRRRVAGG